MKRWTVILCLALLTPTFAKQPNILFIAVDDLRPELGCYGSQSIKSPHIDALAKTAVTFERAYCQVAVCNPSRVSIMTGLRPDTTKVWDLITHFRDTTPDAVTIPQHFRKHGYYAVSFGKIFHNPWPDNQSWNEPHAWPKNSKLWSTDARERLADHRQQMKADGKSQAAIRRMRAQATEIVDIPDSEHIDGAIADQALAAMRRLAQREEPFFLAAGFVRPHLPFVVPRKYWKMYEREKIPLADNRFIPRNSPSFAMNTMYELRDYFDYAHTDDPRFGTLTEDEQRELKHGYYASVSLIDAQVGRLLDELKKLGLADNTVVVLWGDHGWKLGEHNSWCKQSNYEIDTRVPLIIRAPGATGNGKKAKGLVEFVDVYPTLCELAGLPVPEVLEGTSLKAVLENVNRSVKEVAISQYKRRQRDRELMGYTMRTDRYRYIEWLDRATAKPVDRELYDHRTDPQENENIAYEGDEALLDRLSRQLWASVDRPRPTGQLRPRLTIQNHSRQTITVYWDRPGGPPKKVAVVPIGGRHVSNTRIGHRFLIHGNVTDFKTSVTVKRKSQTFTLRAGDGPLIPKKKKEAKRDPRPNILFLMADDWSHPHASILGDPVVKTPTFDRIAREGVLFANAFVSAPSCTPSRHAVASGQYHWRLGEGMKLGGSIPKETLVYPDLLADAGYATGFSRKGTAPSTHRFRGNDPFGSRFRNFEEFYAQRDQGKPFCFWYGAGEPHRPYDWQASKRAGMALDQIKAPSCLPDNETVRTDIGDYYLKVQRFDRDAAKILERISEAGELENTIVVMSSDNGMPFPRCKATLYDMGTRVPLAVRWGRKVTGGRTIEDFVKLTDLAPTFLTAAGLPVPREMTGRSLLPQLKAKRSGAVESWRDHVLMGMEQHVYPNPSRAIRTKDFLYIRNFSPRLWRTGETPKPPYFEFEKTPWPTSQGAFSFNVDPSPSKQWMLHHPNECRELYRLAFGRRTVEELYDLRKDPDQLENVVTEPAYAEVRTRLARRLIEELRASGDPRFKQPDHATVQIHGWTVQLHDRLLLESPVKTREMLRLLGPQLERVVKVVPKKALADLRKVPIWINPEYPGVRPTAEYHYEAHWLRANKRNPAMERAVEVTNVENFAFENKRMPYLMLHELAHAYHEQVLGFDEPRVKAAYEKARASGGYNRVKRFNGHKIVDDKAYAMSNHKEYFAEATEAYFGKNDFYPFNRNELKKHDSTMFELLGKLWNR